MVHSLTPEHLAFGNGLVFDGLNQARVIVSPDRHIGAFRHRPHAQNVIGRWPQEFSTSLSGYPGIKIMPTRFTDYMIEMRINIEISSNGLC